MLDEILSEIRRRVVFRLSRVSSDDERFLADFNLDADGRDVRGALSDPKLDEVVTVTYSIDTNDVVVDRLPQG